MKSVLETVAKEIAQAINGTIQSPNYNTNYEKPYFVYDYAYSIIGKFDGRAVVIDLEFDGSFEIKYNCDINFRFKIRPNKLLSYFEFAADKRIYSGDQRFDKQFLVRSNCPEIASWIANDSIKDYLRQLKPLYYLEFLENLLQYSSKMDGKRMRSSELIAKLKILNDIAASLENLR